MAAEALHSPRITPQLHHQNTTSWTPILLKTPAKSPTHQLSKKTAQKSAFAPFEFGAEDAEEAVGAVAEEADAGFGALAVDVVV
jgi:hypothetical protein